MPARMRTPIQSVKHIQTFVGVEVVAANTNQLTLLTSVQDYTGNANQVPVGAVVKAVYIELWCAASGNTQGNLNLNFEKLSGTSSTMNHADALALNDYANKNNVLYITQGLTPDTNANPVPFMRGWFKVPKGMQRMALGNKLVVNMSALVENFNLCGLVIFKHYT